MEAVDSRRSGQQLRARFFQYVKSTQKKLSLPYNKFGSNGNINKDVVSKKPLFNLVVDSSVSSFPTAKSVGKPGRGDGTGDSGQEPVMHPARHYYSDSAASDFASAYIPSFQSHNSTSSDRSLCVKQAAHEAEISRLRKQLAELEADHKQMYLDLETLQCHSKMTLAKKDEDIVRLKSLLEQQSGTEAVAEVVKQKESLYKQVSHQQKVLQEMEKQFVNMHIWSQSLQEEYHHVRSESNERIAELEQLIDFEGERLNELSARNQHLKGEKDRLGSELMKALRLGEQFMKRADTLQQIVEQQQEEITSLQHRLGNRSPGTVVAQPATSRLRRATSAPVMDIPCASPCSSTRSSPDMTFIQPPSRDGTCFNVKTLITSLPSPFKVSRKFFKMASHL